MKRNIGVVESCGELGVDGNAVRLDREEIDCAAHDIGRGALNEGAEERPASGGNDGGDWAIDGLGSSVGSGGGEDGEALTAC